MNFERYFFNHRFLRDYGKIAAILATVFSVSIYASQPGVTTANSATASYSIASPQLVNPFAITDEPVPLADALIRELRRGSYVLYVRHGAVQPASTDTRGTVGSARDTATEWWKNCATTQNLAPSALPQAQAIGIALRNQRIVVDEVLSSEFCRTYDTGLFLGMAALKRTAALNASTAFESQQKTPAEQSAGLQQLLSTPVPAGKNRVLVGHTVLATAVHPVLSILTETQTAIFKPAPNAGGVGFQFVTILTPGQWQWLGKQVVGDAPNTTNLTAAAPQVTQPVQPQATQIPVIDPARELKGVALVYALRKGGYNLYMRHANSTIGTDQDFLKVPMWWENCAIQRNLSEQGRDQARKVGNAITELKIPLGEIKTSQFCRVRDTAYAMNLGAIEITEELNHSLGQRVGTDVNAMRYALLASTPTKGTNSLLISHTHGSPRPEEQVMTQLAESEIVVYQPDGKGNSEPVARIPTVEWDNLIKLMNPGKN